MGFLVKITNKRLEEFQVINKFRRCVNLSFII